MKDNMKMEYNLQELVQPVRLLCQHYFCFRCVTCDRCPVCYLAVDCELVEDSVLRYVIESSHERTEICANCDQTIQPMFFCETCQQPLCGHCRTLTHQAKIFALHHITPLEERGRLRSRVICDVHNEPYIVFCQELMKLMCIECFNATSSVKRGNFLNVDLAHKVCCDKLEKATTQLRLFQDDVTEQIELRRHFSTELENNFNTHIQELNTTFDSLIEHITRLKTSLVDRLNREKTEKQTIVCDQLQSLENLKGPILLNLLSASIFGSYASKIDLLHYFSDLSKSVELLLSKKTEKLSLSSNCFVNFRRELAKELFVNFFNSLDVLKSEDGADVMSSEASVGPPMSDPLEHPAIFSDSNRVLSGNSSNQLVDADFIDEDFSQNFSNNILMKFNDISSNDFRFLADLNATFNEQMRRIDGPMAGFLDSISLLFKELVDMQRDITLRRCLIATDNFTRLSKACENLKNELGSHRIFVNHLQPFFRELWHKQIQRIRQQQVLYRSKIDELSYLHRRAEKIFESAQQLQPFAVYIASIIGTMDSRRTQITHVSPMEQICMQISSLEPDSDQRIDAIEREEESRRLAKMQESLAMIPEAQHVRMGLKETKAPQVNKATHHQAVIIVEDRDRSSFMPSAKFTKSKQKSRRENRLEGVNCVSPIFSSSSVTLNEIEIRCASSLAAQCTSNMSLSPAISQCSLDAFNDGQNAVNDINSLLDLEIRNQNQCSSTLTTDNKNIKRKISPSTAEKANVPEIPADAPIVVPDRSETVKPVEKLSQVSPQIKSITNLIETQLQLKIGEDKNSHENVNRIEAKTQNFGSAEAQTAQPNVPSTSSKVKYDPEIDKNVEKTPLPPKNIQPIGATEATIEARCRLLQSIKEHVKRID